MNNLIGKKFGKLLVLERNGSTKDKHARWLCKCDCGGRVSVASNYLKSGKIKSCGCLKIKHGHAKNRKMTKTYNAWIHMKQRCINPNNRAYKDYGGRGIKVCKRWLKFENFLRDVGEIPRGLTLDRTNNNKGYSPRNCRLTTMEKQSGNRRDNRFYHFNNETQILNDWAKEYNIKRQTLAYRLNKGMSIENALTTPVKKRRK